MTAIEDRVSDTADKATIKIRLKSIKSGRPNPGDWVLFSDRTAARIAFISEDGHTVTLAGQKGDFYLGLNAISYTGETAHEIPAVHLAQLERIGYADFYGFHGGIALAENKFYFVAPVHVWGCLIHRKGDDAGNSRDSR